MGLKYHPVDDLLQRENDTFTMKKVNWPNLTSPMMVQTLIVWIWSWGNRQVGLPNYWPHFSNLPLLWKKKNYFRLKAVREIWKHIQCMIFNCILYQKCYKYFIRKLGKHEYIINTKFLECDHCTVMISENILALKNFVLKYLGVQCHYMSLNYSQMVHQKKNRIIF